MWVKHTQHAEAYIA